MENRIEVELGSPAASSPDGVADRIFPDTPHWGFGGTLENIRQFLTSSALTLVIDLVFTVVFLVLMFYYSTPLTLIVLASFPFYIGISAGAAPLFRRRLDEKCNRGSEDQAFLVKHHGRRDANLPPMPGVSATILRP